MAETTMSGFAALMKQRSATIAANVDRIVRKTALLIDRTVTFATPVDTGRARANWLVSLDAPIEAATESVDVNGTLQEADRVIAGYRAGNSIIIANNLPYIVPLNNGHSAQAPAGFVEIAVNDSVRALNGETTLKEVPG